jgi:hypothetical protein
MEVFGDFYKDYIAYQKKFEFVLAFMSKEIREEYTPSFTKGVKHSLKRLFLSRIPYGIGVRIIDDVPVAKRDAITNIYELIHRMQREMNKIQEFHRKYKGGPLATNRYESQKNIGSTQQLVMRHHCGRLTIEQLLKCRPCSI